ncbi:MAG: hypothetical protein OEV11_14770, partial [Deltaproteobacteria bacterium]|nr:hypothetical protein [Deltaproteobacteria bacterium]
IHSCYVLQGGITSRFANKQTTIFRTLLHRLLIKSMRTRMFHESPAATADMAVLPGVLGCRTLRRTVQVRLGSNTLWLPGGTPIFTVSRLQFMKHPG